MKLSPIEPFFRRGSALKLRHCWFFSHFYLPCRALTSSAFGLQEALSNPNGIPVYVRPVMVLRSDLSLTELTEVRALDERPFLLAGNDAPPEWLRIINELLHLKGASVDHARVAAKLADLQLGTDRLVLGNFEDILDREVLHTCPLPP